MPRLICVYVAAHPQQAHFLRNLLAGYGIDAQVLNDSLAAAAEDPGGWSTAPRVVVPPEDAEFAWEIVEDFEASWQRNASRGPNDSGEPLQWSDWPRCPRCRKPRLTVCPGCQSAGTRFPLAEFLESDDEDEPIRLSGADDGERVLVLCPTCDEAFTPEFYRHCENCDYDFGQGRAVPRESFGDALRHRAHWALSVTIFTIIWAYCAWRWLAR